MSGENAPSCLNCPFYVASDEHKGECHARPPVMFPMITGQGLGLFPPVGASNFCGWHPVIKRRASGELFK